MKNNLKIKKSWSIFIATILVLTTLLILPSGVSELPTIASDKKEISLPIKVTNLNHDGNEQDLLTSNDNINQIIPRAPLGPPTFGDSYNIDVSLPIQVTINNYYERGQSIVYDDTNYWFFYGRHTSFQGNYSSGNPDSGNYEIYYVKATSISDLATEIPVKVTNADNIFQGQTSCVNYDSKIWVFAANGTNRIIAWNSTDGSSWTEHDTGIDGAEHPIYG